MSDNVTQLEPRPLKRPSLERTKPNRAQATLYRTADQEKTGLGGVTLEKAEDAMVAAVRMAYDIADSQIARSKRLADRLKGAADRATGANPDEGEKSAQDTVDAASRLVNNAMLSGMSWVEALLGADKGLAPRLAAAQLKAVKTVLFNRGRDLADDLAEQDVTAAYDRAVAGLRDAAGDVADQVGRFRSAGARTTQAVRDVRIRLPKKGRRAVEVVRWEVEQVIPGPLVFYRLGEPSMIELEGELSPGDGVNDRPTLQMPDSLGDAPSGRWRAAVCDRDGEQFGIVEIEI